MAKVDDVLSAQDEKAPQMRVTVHPMLTILEGKLKELKKAAKKIEGKASAPTLTPKEVKDVKSDIDSLINKLNSYIIEF